MSKTGLVLSGGGAKGAYQVGVMKALLELNVPVDMLRPLQKKLIRPTEPP